MKIQEQYTYPEVANLLLKSIEKVTNHIAFSYGPIGGKTIMHTLILDEKNPNVTNDGFTILNNLHYSDPFDSLARRLLWNASFQTNVMVGDGTTTSILLTGQLIADILRNPEFTKNPRRTENFLNESESFILEKLSEKIKKIENNEQLRQLAFISSRNEKLANIIKDLYNQLGNDYAKTFIASYTTETQVETIDDGILLNCDVLDTLFFNDLANLNTKIEDRVGVVVTTKKLLTSTEVVRIVEVAKLLKHSNVLLLCNDAETNAINACKQTITDPGIGVKIYPLRAPYLGERQKTVLNDVAFLVGANLIDNHQGRSINNIKTEDFGTCKEIYFDARKTIIKGGNKNVEKVKEMLEQVHNLTMNASDTGNDLVFLEDRRKNLIGKVAMVKIGSQTFVETMDLTTRFEDALRNSEAAVKLGILEGAGVPLFEIAKEYYSENDIYQNLMFTFLTKPINTLRETVDMERISLENLDVPYRYDYLSGQTHDNLIDIGVIDSYASIANSIRMAFSLARSVCALRMIIIEDIVSTPHQSYMHSLAKNYFEKAPQSQF